MIVNQLRSVIHQSKRCLCRHWRLAVLLSGLSFAIGCSKPAPAPEAVPESTPLANSSIAKETNEPVAEPESDFSGVPPEDLFETTTDAPNFELVGKSDRPNLVDAVVFTTEPPAVDSQATQFIVSNEAASTNTDLKHTLPRGFVAVPEARWINGWPQRIRSEVDQSELVLIPAGECLVGSNAGSANSQPIVSLVLDAFYIGVNEVRLGQYLEGKKRAATRGQSIGEPLNIKGLADHPALGVAWVDAKNFAASLGCELPSEAQWEKAARGIRGLSRPWGESRPLWNESREIDQIDVVGRHPEDRSVFGVFDMSGNAWEWTNDFYSEDAWKSLRELAPDRRNNWTGPKTGAGVSQRVVKGGGSDWEVYVRRGIRMPDRLPQVGFRVVLNLGSK